ncbi:MAG: hypothetical protein CMM46_00635 [Rhodospirillaceae bacterium]|nr:hypothetical protein [Rhodospirillaceae bacterium]|tara:strand:+ start:3639 stop:4217 length:579 start_codon:yes stop_codon:yes gene_type:complete
MFDARMVFPYPRPGAYREDPDGLFWGGAVSCKRSLFRYGLFDPVCGMVEDAELGLRLSHSIDFAAVYDGRQDAIPTRNPGSRDLIRRRFRLGCFHLMWQRNYPTQVSIGQRTVYKDAERFAGATENMNDDVLALEELSRQLADSVGDRPDPRSVGLLESYFAAMNAAAALGWLAARGDEPVDVATTRVVPDG